MKVITTPVNIIRIIAALSVIALLSACGGSDSKSSSAEPINSPGLTFSDTKLSVVSYEGIPQKITIRATANQNFPSPINIAIIDTSGVISQNVMIKNISTYIYDATLEVSPTLTSGIYDGNIEIRLCKDNPIVCQNPHIGSPWKLPYHFEVKSWKSSVKLTTEVLRYNSNSTFTIAGTGLKNGSQIYSQACVTPIEQMNGNESQRNFTCKTKQSGAVPITIANASGEGLYAGVLMIPQPQVTMSTSLGTFILELNPMKAPITVDNFFQYIESGFYTNKIFHRVISDFVIQGGGFNASMTEAPTRAPIKLEAGNGLSNLRGSIAMARTNAPDSATSQFFINVVDNPILDANSGGYVVFGKVISGLAVVDKIKVVPTTTIGNYQDVPVTPIVITSAVQTQ